LKQEQTIVTACVHRSSAIKNWIIIPNLTWFQHSILEYYTILGTNDSNHLNVLCKKNRVNITKICLIGSNPEIKPQTSARIFLYIILNKSAHL
jgi:hypothetical protein